MQTGGSHFLYEHRPLDVGAVKQVRHRKTARVRREASAFAAVREAAEFLTVAGRLVFDTATLEQQVRELGHGYSSITVRQAVRAEAEDPGGCLAWARTGWYRLATTELPSGASQAVTGMLGQPGAGSSDNRRPRPPGAPQPTRSTPAVRIALEHLLPADKPDATATRREVEEYLASVGVPYRGRAVRLGIAELLDEHGGLFVRLPSGKIGRAPARESGS